MTPNQPETRGQFVRRSDTRPACEDTLQIPTPDAEPITGRLATPAAVRPALEVDCSDWGTVPLALELLLDTSPEADGVQLALRMQNALKAVNRLDRTLGGSGLSILTGKQTPEGLRMVLLPDDEANALARVRGICEWINQAKRIPGIPAFVRQATVYVA